VDTVGSAHTEGCSSHFITETAEDLNMSACFLFYLELIIKSRNLLSGPGVFSIPFYMQFSLLYSHNKISCESFRRSPRATSVKHDSHDRPEDLHLPSWCTLQPPHFKYPSSTAHSTSPKPSSSSAALYHPADADPAISSHTIYTEKQSCTPRNLNP
jgi:hypothetical protein